MMAAVNRDYTRAQFLADLKTLGMTQVRFAQLFGLHKITVAQWGRVSDRDPMPRWVGPLMAAWLELERLRPLTFEVEQLRSAMAALSNVLAMRLSREKNI